MIFCSFENRISPPPPPRKTNRLCWQRRLVVALFRHISPPPSHMVYRRQGWPQRRRECPQDRQDLQQAPTRRQLQLPLTSPGSGRYSPSQVYFPRHERNQLLSIGYKFRCLAPLKFLIVSKWTKERPRTRDIVWKLCIFGCKRVLRGTNKLLRSSYAI